MPRFPFQVASRRWAAALAAVWLAGCASVPAVPVKQAAATAAAAAESAEAPGAAASAAKPGAKPEPGAPKPFERVVEGAERQEGFIPVWRKDEQVWLEIHPDRLNKPIMFTASVTHSIGERGAFARQMAGDWLVELRIVGKVFQVLAKNTGYRAASDGAERLAIAQSFSDSLLGAAPVASAPRKDGKAVLVDASFLFSDIIGYSTLLEQAFRLPYAIDRKNSHYGAVRAGTASTSITTQMHFATPRIPAPPLSPPPPTVPRVTPPQTLPDPRSFFLGVAYSFVPLPDPPMAPRPSDPRIGHFSQAFDDLGDDLKPSAKVRYVNRWRLEKKDPAAALSEPVRPITFWLDRNIPQRYRDAVAAGVLEWNKAFEKIGFKDALAVRQQPDDADFDLMDGEHASIQWVESEGASPAGVGPSAVDPRSGEIVDADIQIFNIARSLRRFYTDDAGPSASVPPSAPLHRTGRDPSACTYAAEAAGELGFALDLLEARDALAPDSPETDAFVKSVIKDIVTHEVGHTLGLKHNFRASTAFTQAQLRDKSFTDAHGISASVMDYNPFNLALAGEPGADLNMSTLGAYDYWAIEYAYRPLDPAAEAQGLQAIAARSTEPALAYADDTDAGGFGGNQGLDPRDNRFDLGDDPLAYARRRLALTRELWDRVQQRGPRAGDDPQRLRRSVLSGFRQLARMPAIVAKYVGGMYVERDLPGNGSRPTFRPVESDRQRDALAFLTGALFSVDSFHFKPALLTSLGTDFNDWTRAAPLSVPASVLQLQTQALNDLLDAGTARRLLDLPYYLPERERAGAISLDEVYATVQAAVWSELKSGTDIDPLRRNLQREHLKRLTALLTRGAPGLPADALSLTRMRAGELQAQLRRAAGARGLSVETRSHLADSLGTLTEALRATMQRS
jgi:hypothetical protein